MNLRGGAYLTDENIHPDVVTFLRGEGCDVLDVRESGLTGSDDLLLIRKAFAEQRVVLTHDSDFGTLAIAAGEPITGIIYLRPGHIRAEYTVDTLRVVFSQQLNLITPFIVVAQRRDSAVRIRIRRL